MDRLVLVDQEVMVVGPRVRVRIGRRGAGEDGEGERRTADHGRLDGRRPINRIGHGGQDRLGGLCARLFLEVLAVADRRGSREVAVDRTPVFLAGIQVVEQTGEVAQAGDVGDSAAGVVGTVGRAEQGGGLGSRQGGRLLRGAGKGRCAVPDQGAVGVVDRAGAVPVQHRISMGIIHLAERRERLLGHLRQLGGREKGGRIEQEGAVLVVDRHRPGIAYCSDQAPARVLNKQWAELDLGQNEPEVGVVERKGTQQAHDRIPLR